ncbi:DUF3592 domain-containing protein [Amycolatopsis sp. NPDC088138]|uniref:DUF3592 domain-containing protein n=1 Tax=Amycolatopsis sp. NPDC088138 TaxID=3363938 RepID=UPI0038170A0C
MPEETTWLPPIEDTVEHDTTDLGAPTRKLRVLGRRALIIMVAWLVASCGVFAGLIAYRYPAGELLRDGVHVTGTVTWFDDHPPAIRVSYDVRGELYHATIPVSSGRHYTAGRPLTVIYDPAAPSRARTTLEDRLDPRVSALFWILGLFVLTFAGVSLVASVRWRRRHAAVLRTGWRPALVTVRPDHSFGRNRHLPDLLVEYRDGSRAELRASISCHGSTFLRHQPAQPAWAGGSGPDMVVLFFRGSSRQPYAVPAFGRKPRAGSA